MRLLELSTMKDVALQNEFRDIMQHYEFPVAIACFICIVLSPDKIFRSCFPGLSSPTHAKILVLGMYSTPNRKCISETNGIGLDGDFISERGLGEAIGCGKLISPT